MVPPFLVYRFPFFLFLSATLNLVTKAIGDVIASDRDTALIVPNNWNFLVTYSHKMDTGTGGPAEQKERVVILYLCPYARSYFPCCFQVVSLQQGLCKVPLSVPCLGLHLSTSPTLDSSLFPALL